MINISRLYLGAASPSDHLRYGRRRPAAQRRPVVVWNVTQACNLACVHCYSRSGAAGAETELALDQGKALIRDLAEFGAPVLLFSGGEPMLRGDLLALARYAADCGLRTALSTNGTLLDDAAAAALKDAGVTYAGISLDGLRETHDEFRGSPGAFDRALDGIRACRRVGLKVGLRYTLTRANAGDVPGIFDLIEAEQIPRVCFYHLAYSGRGAEIAGQDLAHDQTRRIVDLIVDRTARLHAQGTPVDLLTVGNHTDGPYLHLRMLGEGNERADEVLELLRIGGGNSSGVGIGCVGWDGTVYPDQFWRTRPLGNVRERPFSAIWTDTSNPFMAQLKQKHLHVTGRCAACRFLDACGGNLRVRAEAATGDPWAPDPACYLTDDEIGLPPREERADA
jgi:Fe-coproporphyrin III synthase